MDILRYQRMVKNGFHRFSYGLLRISEAIKPRIEIHSAETYHIYRFLFDAARLHVLYHWALLMWHAPQSECAMTMTSFTPNS